MIITAAQVIEAFLFLGVAATLLWFVWRVVLRRLYRVWHIRRIGEKRELRELMNQRPENPDPK